MKKSNIVLKGLLKENPVFVLLLGTCPTLATSTSVISALAMGLAATAVLICSNIVISALRNVIPDKVRIPCYIVVIAGFVTIVQLLMQAYLPSLYEMLGVYLALIVVNCIILGRAEGYANSHKVGEAALDGLGMGIGFLLALLCMAIIREVLGNGSFAGMAIPFLKDHCIPILVQSPGGFLVFGIMIALVSALTNGKAPIKKSFDCEGCPSAKACGKLSCSGCANEEKEAAVND